MHQTRKRSVLRWAGLVSAGITAQIIVYLVINYVPTFSSLPLTAIVIVISIATLVGFIPVVWLPPWRKWINVAIKKVIPQTYRFTGQGSARSSYIKAVTAAMRESKSASFLLVSAHTMAYEDSAEGFIKKLLLSPELEGKRARFLLQRRDHPTFFSRARMFVLREGGRVSLSCIDDYEKRCETTEQFLRTEIGLSEDGLRFYFSPPIFRMLAFDSVLFIGHYNPNQSGHLTGMVQVSKTTDPVLFASLSQYYDEKFDGASTRPRKAPSVPTVKSDIETARSLLAQGLVHHAALVLGVTLERTLHNLSSKNKIDINRSIPMSQLNRVLHDAGVYNGAQAEAIREWIYIRNIAAHGLQKSISEESLKSMIEGIVELGENSEFTYGNQG